jgi:hypothetical protein
VLRELGKFRAIQCFPLRRQCRERLGNRAFSGDLFQFGAKAAIP